MSTKIYVAYRVRIEMLNPFIDTVREQVYLHMRDNIIKRMIGAVDPKHVKDRVAAHIKLYKPAKKYTKKELAKLEQSIRVDSVFDLLKKLTKSNQRSPGMDVEYTLNIWLQGRFFYIIPVGEERNRIKLKLAGYVRDYSYWDNVDKPENVKSHAWKCRGDKWEEINLGTGVHGHNARRMNHAVIDLGRPYGDFDFEHAMREHFLSLIRTKGGRNGKRKYTTSQRQRA